MSLINPKLITLEKPTKKTIVKRYQEQKEPQACNPIYNKIICIGCKYCHKNKKGRAKNFKTLWCLYQHFTYHHRQEQDYKNHTMDLAELIIRGVLL